MAEVWPAALTAGVCFAIPQFLVSNFHGPWLVDIVASLCSIGGLLLLLRFWAPAKHKVAAPALELAKERHGGVGDFGVLLRTPPNANPPAYSSRALRQAWLPWVLLSVLVFVWGVPAVKKFLNTVSEPRFEMPGLHNQVVRAPPVVPPPTAQSPTKPEEAIFKLSWLTATGTGILAAAILAGLCMGFSPVEMAVTYWRALKLVRLSLLTIAAMLALGYVTRYSGTDATLGLALARTGPLYPFFGAMLGWLGVALTGSDTSSNVLFGSLQKITANQLGLSPTLMAAANSSGGVMGKMVDAQSIVVASTATNWYGHEGDILRYVFFHSLALAALVGVLVFLQAYVAPFTRLVVR
jgi:lactate permease